MRDVVTVTGESAETVTRGFAGRILKRWAGKTKVAEKPSITLRARTRAAVLSDASQGKVRYTTVNTGRKGREPGIVWHRTRKGKFQVAGQIVAESAFVPSWLHYSNSDWEMIKTTATKYAYELRRGLAAGLKAAGLSRQSVVQIADTIGIDLSKVPGQGISLAGIAKARAAIASNGNHYQNGTGKAQWISQKFIIEMINNFPLGKKAGMDVVLAGVISSEIKYYERNMAEGVFLAQSRVAKAYPFLNVQKTSA